MLPSGLLVIHNGRLKGEGGSVRSMRSSLSGRCSRPRFRESVARWRSSSRAAAWRAL